MIFNGPHITKKTYTIPKIEEVEIDAAISLETPSTGGEDDIPEDPDIPDSVGGGAIMKSPDYGSLKYSSSSSPFGDTSKPQY